MGPFLSSSEGFILLFLFFLLPLLKYKQCIGTGVSGFHCFFYCFIEREDDRGFRFKRAPRHDEVIWAARDTLSLL